MKIRREVTQVMTDQEFHEREELIENIQEIGGKIVDILQSREDLLPAIAERREVHSEERYEHRRILRKPVILTRPKKETLTLILMFSRPPIWLATDKRFVQVGHGFVCRNLNLTSLHVTTLRALHECMRAYHDSLLKR